MKKVRNKAEKRQTLVLIGFFLVTMIVAVVTFQWFRSANYERILKRNMEYQEQSLHQLEKGISEQIGHSLEEIKNIASYYTLVVQATDKDRMTVLEELRDSTAFDHIAYININGKGESTTGETEFKKYHFFDEVMAGASGVDALQYDDADSDTKIIFYTPVYERSRIIGAIAGAYDKSHMESLLNGEIFNFPTRIVLTDGEGNYILKSEGAEAASAQESIFDVLRPRGYSTGYSEEALRAAMEDETVGSYSYLMNGESGGDTICSFVRLEKRNWIIHQTMHSSVTGKLVNEAIYDGMILVGILMGMFCIYIILLLMNKNQVARMERAVESATEHVQAALDKEVEYQQTIRAAYEAANRANAAKSTFLANMSHDIRTPMNAIIGMTAIAGTHMDDPERVADCLGKITVSSKYLLGLINEVLDMSKIESGKMELQKEEFNLPELFDSLLVMSKPQLLEKNHELSVNVRGIEHEKVIGDSQRIQQVFMNLMSNAIKYTPSGGKIILSLSEKQTDTPNIGCYEFVFEDNGIGMTPEFMEQMFDPFARAENSFVEKTQGTGLGMPIAKSIVQMMNGDIKVESEVGKGSRFTVTIFLRRVREEDEMDYSEFIDLSILVADDDETACDSACEILTELGMKGEWVLSGAEAVELVAKRHEENRDFFAVIVDWKMPGMDGIETTAQIRKRVGKDVPIVIITAYDWTDIETEARAAGATAFISKPIFKSRMAFLFHELLGHGGQTEQTPSLEAILQENFEGKRALLVEDNELNAEIAGEILGMAGISVEHVENGKIAVDRMTEVEDDYYDIVFMDVQMPVMNGYDATRAIRALPRAYTKRIPIVAMTANAFAEDVRLAITAGMNGHIAKPLDFNRLLTILNKWLS